MVKEVSKINKMKRKAQLKDLKMVEKLTNI